VPAVRKTDKVKGTDKKFILIPTFTFTVCYLNSACAFTDTFFLVFE